jgi:hypothetical protein
MIRDLTIPPYYCMQNCILIACGQDDWESADVYRYAAEDAYAKAHRKATKQNDKDSLEVLEEVRNQLDQLIDERSEDVTAQTGIKVHHGNDDIDMNNSYYDALENDGVLYQMEDREELSEVENADELAAERIILPIRTSSGSADGDVTVQDATPSSATPTSTQTTAALSLAEPFTTRPQTLRAKKSTS